MKREEPMSPIVQKLWDARSKRWKHRLVRKAVRTRMTRAQRREKLWRRVA